MNFLDKSAGEYKAQYESRLNQTGGRIGNDRMYDNLLRSTFKLSNTMIKIDNLCEEIIHLRSCNDYEDLKFCSNVKF